MRIIIATLLTTLAIAAQASENSIAAMNDLIASQYDQPGEKVRVDVRDKDIERVLTGCPSPTYELPSRSPSRGGRLSVAVTCNNDRSKAQYLVVKVTVFGQYLRAKEDLLNGHVITAKDLELAEADLSDVARNVALEVNQVVGMQVSRSIRAGSPIRLTQLRPVIVVKRMAFVVVSTTGSGFAIKSEGQALENGAINQTIKVRISKNRIIQALVVGPNRLLVTI